MTISSFSFEQSSLDSVFRRFGRSFRGSSGDCNLFGFCLSFQHCRATRQIFDTLYMFSRVFQEPGTSLVALSTMSSRGFWICLEDTTQNRF